MTNSFICNEKTYDVCVQTADRLYGVSKIDTCCNNIIAVNCVGLVYNYRAFKGEPTYNFIARNAALSCLTDAAEFEEKAILPFNKEAFKGPISVPPIEPEIVPGTDPGSKYVVVAQTLSGYVARRQGNGFTSPRIRVVKSDPAKSWPLDAYQLNGYGLLWGTHKPDHLGHEGGNIERTAILIARGIEILLKLGKQL